MTGWMSSPRSARFFYQCCKLRRNRHALERVDVCAACVSLRHQTDSSAYGSADNAQQLTQTLSDITLTNTPEEHVPMHANMFNR